MVSYRYESGEIMAKEYVAAIIYNEKMDLLMMKKEGVWYLPSHLYQGDFPQADLMEFLCQSLAVEQIRVKENICTFEENGIYHAYALQIDEYFTLKKAPILLRHEAEDLKWWSKHDMLLSDETFFIQEKTYMIKQIGWEEAANQKYKEITDTINQNSRFLRNNHMRVISMSDGLAKVELDISEDLFNAHGFVHGGALFSLADNTAGAAAHSTGRKCVTLTGNINYIKPGLAGKLIGVAHEVSCGKTTGVYDVHIFNEHQQLLAKATFTMFFLKQEKLEKIGK